MKRFSSQEDIQEDFGWKLVHGEVFRAPSNPMALAVLSGNGAQLCAMLSVTLGMCHTDSIQNGLMTRSRLSSFCFTGLSLSVKSRFVGNSDDGFLDAIREVIH